MAKARKLFIGLWLVLFLLIEWVADLVTKVWHVIHTAIRDLTLAIDNEYNKKTIAGEPDSGKK